jgi:hypothetical protein
MRWVSLWFDPTYELLGVPLDVTHVPTEGLKEGVDELDAHVGFLVFGALINVQVTSKALDELDDLGGRSWVYTRFEWIDRRENLVASIAHLQDRFNGCADSNYF